ncbi:hypothetical protein [Nocardiopsis sp. Huas11]|uniref:hypothetical protein n=1 Tax=Nocardiopsis sp. Huas11 TaxID=2183912 RepID=UPI0018F4CACF
MGMRVYGFGEVDRPAEGAVDTGTVAWTQAAQQVQDLLISASLARWADGGAVVAPRDLSGRGIAGRNGQADPDRAHHCS